MTDRDNTPQGSASAQRSAFAEALQDCRTHRDAWRSIIESARDAASSDRDDMDEKGYITHELKAFDRTFAALAAPVAPGGGEMSQHIGWLKQFVQGMDENNWRDMKLRAERQLEQIAAETRSPAANEDARSLLAAAINTLSDPHDACDFDDDKAKALEQTRLDALAILGRVADGLGSPAEGCSMAFTKRLNEANAEIDALKHDIERLTEINSQWINAHEMQAETIRKLRGELSQQAMLVERMSAALEKISGRREYEPGDHQVAVCYKREEGLWTTDEYLADAALPSTESGSGQ